MRGQPAVGLSAALLAHLIPSLRSSALHPVCMHQWHMGSARLCFGCCGTCSGKLWF